MNLFFSFPFFHSLGSLAYRYTGFHGKLSSLSPLFDMEAVLTEAPTFRCTSLPYYQFDVLNKGSNCDVCTIYKGGGG